MIRKGYVKDIPKLLEFAEMLVKETSYNHIKPDRARIKTTIETMISAGFCMVAEVDNKVVGVMLGDCFTPWYSNDKLALDYTIYVLPEHRNGFIAYKLIKAFENWSVSMGAKQIRCGVGTGVKGVGRLYEKMQFKNVGGWFLKNI